MDEDRTALVGRWLDLTREILPGLAVSQNWPIWLDHCFMRVFLDHAVGGRWDKAMRRPAIRHIAAAELQTALALAEAVLADPSRLPALNAQSLAWRAQRRVRAGAVGGTRGGV